MHLSLCLMYLESISFYTHKVIHFVHLHLLFSVCCCLFWSFGKGFNQKMKWLRNVMQWIDKGNNVFYWYIVKILRKKSLLCVDHVDYRFAVLLSFSLTVSIVIWTILSNLFHLSVIFMISFFCVFYATALLWKHRSIV